MENSITKAQNYLAIDRISKYKEGDVKSLVRILNQHAKEAKAEQREAISELKQALEFFDKVNAAPIGDQISARHDHWDWLESAVRKVVEKNNE